MAVNQAILRFWPQIQETAQRHKLTAQQTLTWLGLLDFESSGDPNAQHKGSKATGLGQVMPREAGVQFRDRPTAEALKDPGTNLEWSARIFKAGLDRYGSEDKALAAYLGAIDRNGNITNARDANGTDGPTYIARVRGRQNALAPLIQGAPAPVRAGAAAAGAATRMAEFVWPVAGRAVGEITNRFGGKQAYSAGMTTNIGTVNRGEDLKGAYGTPALAVTDGEVIAAAYGFGDQGKRNAKDNGGWGNSVVIRHTDGREVRYSHLAQEGKPPLAVGQKVAAGQQIGRVGDSGNATGPHLDMETKVNGQHVEGTALGAFKALAAPVPEGGQGAGAVPVNVGLSVMLRQQAAGEERRAQEYRRTMDAYQGQLAGLEARRLAGDPNAAGEIRRLRGEEAAGVKGEIPQLNARIVEAERLAAEYSAAAEKAAADEAKTTRTPEDIAQQKAQIAKTEAEVAALNRRLETGGLDPLQAADIQSQIATRQAELELRNRAQGLAEQEFGLQAAAAPGQRALTGAQTAAQEWAVQEGQAMLGPSIRRTLAAAGVDEATVTKTLALLEPQVQTAWAELSRLQQLTPEEVESGRLNNDLQRARIAEATQTLGPNIRGLLARAGLDEQQITTAQQMLPLELADLNQQTKLRSAQTSLTQAQRGLTVEQERQAKVETDFLLQDRASWETVAQRIRENPNATADQINEWALGAATTLKDWSEAYRTQLDTARARSEQHQATQQLQLGQQTADSNVRSQRMEEALGMEQQRSVETRDLTGSLRPGQAGPMRRMAQLAAAAPLVGAEGLRGVATSANMRGSDLAPIQKGYELFRRMVDQTRASAPDVRMAPTITAPPPIQVRFQPPGAPTMPAPAAPPPPPTPGVTAPITDPIAQPLSGFAPPAPMSEEEMRGWGCAAAASEESEMTATGGTNYLAQVQETAARPAWSLPNGNAPDIVAQYYLRSDTPTGRSTTPPPPEAREAFRQLILAGGLVPANEAAGRLAVVEGGIEDGQMSPFGVPWIEGLPGGMEAEQWNALTARARQASDQRIAEAEATGLFNGVPTLQRQQWEAAVRSQDFQNATARSLADSEITRRTRELDRLELERQDAVRAGDLTRAQQLVMSREDLAGQMTRLQTSLAQQEAEYARSIAENARQFDVTLGENQRQFDVTQSGWLSGPGGEREATLERERLWTAQQQQAFEQQMAAGERAANPRTGLEAWMGGQRAGLNGQAPVNFVPPTTGQGLAQNPFGQGVGAFGQALGQTNAQGIPGATGAFGQSGVLGPLPTTAFQQALIEGNAVPQTGQVQTQGRWWDPTELQRVAGNLPNTTRTQDFMRGTPSERNAYLGLTSFGGTPDEDVLDRLRRGLPSFTAPTSGRMR